MRDVKNNLSINSYSSLFLLKDFPSVVVVGLGGKSGTGVCGKENWDNCKENIRAAVSGKCHWCFWVHSLRTCSSNISPQNEKGKKLLKKKSEFWRLLILLSIFAKKKKKAYSYCNV